MSNRCHMSAATICDMLPWAVEESEVPNSRRERKKSRTHDDLVAAATQLFATNGYEQTSIEQITELVDVSPRTFFRHFGSKEEVLFPKTFPTEALLAAMAAQPDTSNDLQAIRDAYVELLPKDEAGLQKALLLKRAVQSTSTLEGRQLMLQRQFRGHLATALARRRGVDEPDDRSELVAALAESVIHLAFDKWAATDGKGDLEALLIEQFKLVDDILAPPARSSGRARSGAKSAARSSR
jgi:AcrR family transcriptional regulator